MTTRKMAVCFFTALMFCSGWAVSGDWPQWRGPFLNGSSDERNLPDKWTKIENVLWKAPLPGPSSATPVICKGRVFISSTDSGTNELFALCFEAKTGKSLWQKKLSKAQFDIPRNNMASPSPATDGNYAFFLYADGTVAAFDFDGGEVWTRNLASDIGPLSVKFGYSSSPLLYDGMLYILVLRRNEPYSPQTSPEPLKSLLVGIDPKTGRDVFRHERKSDALDETLDSYSTPTVFGGKGSEQIIIVGADYVTAHHPKTGVQLWRYQYDTTKGRMGRNIPGPVAGNDLIIAVKPRGIQTLALKLQTENDSVRPQVAWAYDQPGPDCSTPAFYKGSIYIISDRRDKSVSRLDATTGQVKWQGSLQSRAPIYASITAADDKLYCINEDSQVTVIDAVSEEFKVIWRMDFNEGPTNSSIAAADGCLYIRTAKNLYCIGNLPDSPKDKP